MNNSHVIRVSSYRLSLSTATKTKEVSQITYLIPAGVDSPQIMLRTDVTFTNDPNLLNDFFKLTGGAELQRGACHLFIFFFVFHKDGDTHFFFVIPQKWKKNWQRGAVVLIDKLALRKRGREELHA